MLVVIYVLVFLGALYGLEIKEKTTIRKEPWLMS